MPGLECVPIPAGRTGPRQGFVFPCVSIPRSWASQAKAELKGQCLQNTEALLEIQTLSKQAIAGTTKSWLLNMTLRKYEKILPCTAVPSAMRTWIVLQTLHPSGHWKVLLSTLVSGAIARSLIHNFQFFFQRRFCICS